MSKWLKVPPGTYALIILLLVTASPMKSKGYISISGDRNHGFDPAKRVSEQHRSLL